MFILTKRAFVDPKTGAEKFLVNGKLHRENGPAVEYPDGRIEYTKIEYKLALALQRKR